MRKWVGVMVGTYDDDLDVHLVLVLEVVSFLRVLHLKDVEFI